MTHILRCFGLHTAGRLKRRLLFLGSTLVSVLLAVLATHAQLPSGAPQRTTVTDTVYRADGSPASGTLLITWPSFTGADGSVVAAGSATVSVALGGSVSVGLIPNEGASPAGTYYKVVYNLDDGTTTTERWVVPAAGPTTIAAVRSTVQLADIIGGGLSTFRPTDYVLKSGDTMTGALTLMVGPTAENHAATRSYVDSAVAGISPTLTNLSSSIAALDTEMDTKLARQGDTPIDLGGIRYATQFPSLEDAAWDAWLNKGTMFIPAAYAGRDTYNDAELPVLDFRDGLVTINRLAVKDPVLDVRAWSASGSRSSFTVDCAAGANMVTIPGWWHDFKIGQGIHLYHCGSAVTLSAPAAPTATVIGTQGSTNYKYRIATVTSNGGESPASPETVITNGVAPDQLGNTRANQLRWNAVDGARAYAIYAAQNGGEYQFAGIVSVPGWAQPWISGRPYHPNDYIRPKQFNGHYYKVTAGTPAETRSRLEDGTTSGIAAGTRTITPTSMNGISAGSVLMIEGAVAGRQERVTVTSVSATTFTAAFAKMHPHGFAIAAISGSAEPTWCTTAGCTVAEGGITYTEQPFSWYDNSPATNLDRPRNISPVPLDYALADDLVTTVAAIQDTNITLTAAPETSVTGATVEHDDTDALLATMQYANTNRTETISHGGLPATLSGAAVYLPYGHFRISRPLQHVPLLWSNGQAVIEQTMPTQNVLDGDVYESTVKGVSLWGGWDQFSFSNANTGGVIRLEDVEMVGAWDFAIYGVGTQTVENDFHLSTQFRFVSGAINGAKHAMFNTCDKAHFIGSSLKLNQRNEEGDSAQFVNFGTLAFDDLFATPGRGAPGERWVDNRGALIAKGSRFGGEYAGLPIVYNFAPYGFEPGYSHSAASVAYMGQSLIMEHSSVCDGSGRPDAAILNAIDALPGYFVLRDVGCLNFEGIIRNSGNLNLDTYFIDPSSGGLVNYDHVKYVVEPVQAPGFLNGNSSIPVQLWGYFNPDSRRTSNAAPVSGNWVQGEIVMNSTVQAVGSSGQAQGWIAQRSGKAAPKWSAGTYALDQFVVPSTDNGHVYRVVVAGTSGVSEPAWCTGSNCTATDGSVTWAEAGASARFTLYGLMGDDAGGLAFSGKLKLNSNTNQATFQTTNSSPYDAFPLRSYADTTEVARLHQNGPVKTFSLDTESSDWDLQLSTNSSKNLLLRSGNIRLLTGGSTEMLSATTAGVSVGGGDRIIKHLSRTATLDYSAWAGSDCQELTISVSGAASGDSVTVGLPDALASTPDVVWSYWARTDSVVVRGCKITVGASSDPAAALVRADVWKH